MSLNFDKMPPPTMELVVLECLIINVLCCEHSFLSNLLLAGKEENHKSLD